MACTDEEKEEAGRKLRKALTEIGFRRMTGPINLRPAYMQMVGDVCKEWGYDLGPERIERVAEATASYRMQGATLGVAISIALGDELILYGEQRPDATPIVGITIAQS